MSVSRVLVANRGEIAVRIIQACQGLGIETVLATSMADRDSLGAAMADRAICIGPASASESYLRAETLVAAARGAGCDALHPGYGFLAESAKLAQLCIDNDLTFIGPLPDQIRQMGNKIEARALAQKLGVPTLSGSQKISSEREALEIARTIGLPVLIKAAAGGGGRGMKIVERFEDLPAQITKAAAEAGAAFGDSTLYLESFIANARHIEVQIIADNYGNLVHLGERDCSLQRRHQKMVEEAPAPNISEALRVGLRSAAVKLAAGIGYRNAGTVEFIVDQDAGRLYFIEMNTRIQVEHPVTEMITGIDLVEEQLRVARGDWLSFSQEDVVFRGHAIECRINAEQPELGFRPSPGLITQWQPPRSTYIRVDSHCREGYQVPIFYDSMLGKLIVYGPDRASAIERTVRAIDRFGVAGVATTLSFQRRLLEQPEFVAGTMNTKLVDRLLAENLNKEGDG